MKSPPESSDPVQPAAKRGFRMTRRRMILGGSLIGGALVVGYAATHPMEVGGAILSGGGAEPEPSAFGSYIRIAPAGSVTIVNRQQELGQGIHAGMAAVVAEELDADWERVKVIASRSNFRAYGPQGSVASRSISSNWDLLRNAETAARWMLVDAAALRWSVPRRLIEVRDGVVFHLGSNRSATFAELLADASRQIPPQQPALKLPKDYRLIGMDRVRRKDSLPKSTDPQVDPSDAMKVKGVIDVFAIETGVAVVTENSFAARRGREALRIAGDDSEAEKRSTPDLIRYYHDLVAGRSDVSPSDFAMKGGQREAPLIGSPKPNLGGFPSNL